MHAFNDIVGIYMIYHSTKFDQYRVNRVPDRTVWTIQLSSNRHHWSTLYIVIHNLQGMALSVFICLLINTGLAQFKTDAVLTTKLEYAGFFVYFFVFGGVFSFVLAAYLSLWLNHVWIN